MSKDGRKPVISSVSISDTRTSMRWSARELAEFLGVSKTLVLDWEKGTRTPSPQLERKIVELSIWVMNMPKPLNREYKFTRHGGSKEFRA